MKHTILKLFSIGKIMLMRNSKGNKMLSDAMLIAIYILEPFIHTAVWILINLALDKKLQHINTVTDIFLLYFGLAQWFCLRKILSGTAHDLYVYHSLECLSFFNFKDLVLAKTFSYFIFYESYVFFFIAIALLVLNTSINAVLVGIIVLSSFLWFLELFLMKFILMLLDSLVPVVSNEIERGIDRLFYFGSSLFYSIDLLSDRTKWLMSYNPLYEYSTILKSIFFGDILNIRILFGKQCIVLIITFLIFFFFIMTNRFSLKKVRASQAFHLTTPY